MIDEELLNVDRFPQSSQNRQSELIARRCRGIERLVLNAQSRKEAVQFAEGTCSQFADECESEIVRGALTERVRQMVEKHWGK